MALLTAYLCPLLPLLPLLASALPVVDPGVFVLQGIVTCDGGEGYCMLGMDCMADIDFMPSVPGQHCDGLADAFTPSVQFTCCRYNERGKATSEAPTTEQSSFTITDVEQFLQEEVPVLDYQQNNEVPEGVDPESLINIVGVVTDMTGVLGLVTEPYRGTIPSHTTAQPTTPTTTMTTTTTTTTPAPKDTVKMQSNSSHASISLADILSNLRATQGPASTSTTERNSVNVISKSGDKDSQTEHKNVQTVDTTPPTVATSTNIESGNTENGVTQSPTPTAPQLLLNTSPPSLDLPPLPSDQGNGLGNIRNTFIIER